MTKEEEQEHNKLTINMLSELFKLVMDENSAMQKLLSQGVNAVGETYPQDGPEPPDVLFAFVLQATLERLKIKKNKAYAKELLQKLETLKEEKANEEKSANEQNKHLN